MFIETKSGHLLALPPVQDEPAKWYEIVRGDAFFYLERSQPGAITTWFKITIDLEHYYRLEGYVLSGPILPQLLTDNPAVEVALDLSTSPVRLVAIHMPARPTWWQCEPALPTDNT